MNPRRSHRVAVIYATCLAASLAIIQPAQASPTMSIDSARTIADYDPSHPGDELRTYYTVSNTSEAGDVNNMVSFTVPAGSDQGVFGVVKPAGWIVSIYSQSTVFLGNGNVIAPGDFKVFKLNSTLTHVGQGEATAVGRGPPIGLPFNPVLVPVPAYHRLDRDHDVDIDGEDLIAFEACASGPAIPFTGDCGWADLDGDDDVDQSDFGIFQRCLTGHGGGYTEGCDTP